MACQVQVSSALLAECDCCAVHFGHSIHYMTKVCIRAVWILGMCPEDLTGILHCMAGWDQPCLVTSALPALRLALGNVNNQKPCKERKIWGGRRPLTAFSNSPLLIPCSGHDPDGGGKHVRPRLRLLQRL